MGEFKLELQSGNGYVGLLLATYEPLIYSTNYHILIGRNIKGKLSWRELVRTLHYSGMFLRNRNLLRYTFCVVS